MARKKSPLKATRLHKQKRRVRILKLSAFIAMVVFVVGGLAWLSRLQALALTEVKVSGTVGIDAQEVESVARDHLAGAYAMLFPKANKFLYPKESIEHDIRAQFPGISSLDVDSKGHALRVSIKERKAAYIWCKGSPEQQDDCYFMDSTGYIFTDAPKISGNVYFTFYGSLENTDPIGKTYLDVAQIEALNTLKKILEEKQITIVSYYAKNEGTREVNLAQGGKIIFKTTQEPRSLAASIELVKLNTQLLSPEGASTLNYIDLRFGNKVYYKTYGDNPVQSEI